MRTSPAALRTHYRHCGCCCTRRTRTAAPTASSRSDKLPRHRQSSASHRSCMSPSRHRGWPCRPNPQRPWSLRRCRPGRRPRRLHHLQHFPLHHHCPLHQRRSQPRHLHRPECHLRHRLRYRHRHRQRLRTFPRRLPATRGRHLAAHTEAESIRCNSKQSRPATKLAMQRPILRQLWGRRRHLPSRIVASC